MPEFERDFLGLTEGSRQTMAFDGTLRTAEDRWLNAP
jgi:hypothetical protein